MKRRIDVKWCVIHLCFGRDRLQDEVKQILILPIVVFCFLSAYMLRLSNHTFSAAQIKCVVEFKNKHGVTFKYNTR